MSGAERPCRLLGLRTFFDQVMKTEKKIKVVTSQPTKKKKKGAPYSRLPGVVNGRITRSLSITEETRRLLRQAGGFIYHTEDGQLSNNQYVHVSNLIIQAACESILRAPATHSFPVESGRPRTWNSKLWPVAFDARAESDDECAVRMLFYRIEDKMECGSCGDP